MSDIARVYKSGTEPVLVAGTAASDAAGAGTPEKPASPKAHVGNANLAQVRDITR